MRVCEARKKDGSPCTLPPAEGDLFCWVHSEKTQEARRRGAAKGGRNKVSADLARLNKKLEQLGDDVMSGKADPRRAAVATNAYIGAGKMIEALAKWREFEEARKVEVDLKRLEVEEVLPRIQELENLLAQKKENRSWGA